MNGQEHGHDTAGGALSLLAMHAPDADRAARVRARCRAALRTRQSRHVSADRPAAHGWRRALEPALVVATSAVFLFEVLTRALHLYRYY